MKKTDYDVIVVGAGPAGTMTASMRPRAVARPDDREAPGDRLSLRCAEGISKKGLAPWRSGGPEMGIGGDCRSQDRFAHGSVSASESQAGDEVGHGAGQAPVRQGASRQGSPRRRRDQA